MNSVCPQTFPDEDLLLLAHGQLPPPRRLRALMHVRNCAACRSRVAQFGRASGLAARALGDPRDPRPWMPAPLGGGGFLAALAGVLATWPGRLLLLAALTIVLLTGFVAVRTLQHRAAVAAPSPGDEPCRPGLPNDLCR